MPHDAPPDQQRVLPAQTDLYHGGGWHAPLSGRRADTLNPGTGAVLASVADAGADDVDAAVAAAQTGFLEWRDVAPV